MIASAAGGLATACVYVALGLLLATGTLPLAIAGTAILAIRSAQSSLTTLLYAMQERGAKRGVASLCLGGGNGVALAVEM